MQDLNQYYGDHLQYPNNNRQPGYPPRTGYPLQPGYPLQQGYSTELEYSENLPHLGFAPQPGYDTQGIRFNNQPGMQSGTSYGVYDPEDQSTKGFDFSEPSIRKGFIRKVYSILTSQLSITLGFIALFKYHEPTQRFVRENPSLFWIALAILVVTVITMACCGDVRRKAPINFIFLALFTLAQSFLLGVATVKFSSEEVLLAVGITAAVCFGLTLFAFQTKWDFTVMGGVLFVALVILMLFGIIAIFFPGKTITLVYASAGALLFSIYLVYDTQMMMGGEHKYSISPEEYIFAALNLYLDIINIFMYILTIIGASRD